MLPDSFIQALADAHEEDAIDLTALRAQCLAKISAGAGEISFLTQSGSNGKTAQQETRMDPAQLLVAVNQALRLVNGKAVSLTYVDFSGFNGGSPFPYQP